MITESLEEKPLWHLPTGMFPNPEAPDFIVLILNKCMVCMDTRMSVR